MTVTQIVATAIALLIGLAIFAYADREQPEEPEDTEESRARRYLASMGDDDE